MFCLIHRIIALILNELDSVLRRLLEEKEDRMKTYHFLVIAKRYSYPGSLSTQTRVVQITVDSDKYTRRDAEHFASREFIHLDDEWIIQMMKISRECYLHWQQKLADSIEAVKGPAYLYKKTNS